MSTGVRRRYLTDPESDLLRYELRLTSGVKSIKSGLQRLCVFYESGRKLSDPTDHRQLIHSHAASNDVLLRRWSMKALGLIGDRDDTRRIVSQLRVETDPEVQTWGAAALLKNADDRGMREICAEAGLEHSVPLLLAARLYAPSHWIRGHWTPVSLSLHADDLTLKWAIFLIGYGKAPDELFDPRHANRIFLGELNQHDTPEISEYSIWALWERPEFGVCDLRIPLEGAMARPANARKWLYRLYMQAPTASGLDPTGLATLRKDDALPAREGLALGFADLPDRRFDTAILDWYEQEPERSIRETLLTGMARHGDSNFDFADLVERSFKNGSSGGGLRTRLLAASEGTNLYGKLKRIAFDGQFAHQGLLQFGSITNYDVKGDLVHVEGSNFSAGRDINAQNMVGGNMVDSANNAIQNIGSDREQDRAILQEVLEFLKERSISDSQRAEVAKAVQDVATQSNPTSKKRLFDTLKSVATAVGAAGSAVVGLSKIVTAVGHWVA